MSIRGDLFSIDRLTEIPRRQGRDVAAVASELIEQAVARPSLDELLAPFRQQVKDSRMSDEEREPDERL